MKAHHLGVGLALLTAGTLALAQAPAAKPTMPQVCTNCHQAKPGNVRGYFENVAFKSKSIQLKIDASTEIVRFDEGTLKVVDVEKTGKARHAARHRRRAARRGSSTPRRTASRRRR